MANRSLGLLLTHSRLWSSIHSASRPSGGRVVEELPLVDINLQHTPSFCFFHDSRGRTADPTDKVWPNYPQEWMCAVGQSHCNSTSSSLVETAMLPKLTYRTDCSSFSRAIEGTRYLLSTDCSPQISGALFLH
ncbi:uncharacterized protein J3R85_007075 [Psidium guajava]|nr:uncharacterized protein J3R85_007075 [Psidium guajava]